jgi:predicted AlkP superfamily pyrophosphatase or phosphodiesterase
MIRFTEDKDHHERGAEKLYYNGTDYFASTVILISLDGFRPDYLNRGITPHMRQFGKRKTRCCLTYSNIGLFS